MVVLLEPVDARVIPEKRFPWSGATGTIVVVYGHHDRPTAYEVEFVIADSGDFALATVDANLVCGAYVENPSSH